MFEGMWIWNGRTITDEEVKRIYDRDRPGWEMRTYRWRYPWWKRALYFVLRRPRFGYRVEFKTTVKRTSQEPPPQWHHIQYTIPKGP